MENNMEVWNALCETDPNRTKKITGKKYKGDSINPNYIYEKLTKQFGSCGIGWGIEILNQSWKAGLNDDIVHSICIGLWYKQGGVKSELIPGFGGTTFSGNYQSGPFTDDDATKKSLTDAITKASQLLGMSADIFGGRWDDSKYIADLKKKYGDHDNGKPFTDSSGKYDPSKKKENPKPGESKSAQNSSNPKMITEGQVRLLGVKFSEANFTDEQRKEWLLKNYAVNSSKDLHMSAVNEIIKIYDGGMLSPLDLEDDIPF